MWRRVGLLMFAVAWGANQFAPMLLVYRDRLGITAADADALFGLYALGLIPGLLVGGRASDRYGRRPFVLGFAALSPLASLTLVLGHDSLAAIAAGRWLAGLCSGVVFGSASAWVQELSNDVEPGVAARRAAVVLTSGFGAGALTTGLMAQWAPAPLWLPLVPHVVVGVAALALRSPAAASRSWSPRRSRSARRAGSCSSRACARPRASRRPTSAASRSPRISRSRTSASASRTRSQRSATQSATRDRSS
jgi:MFS family permease